ncbi:hypothetical protein L6164_013202 [Bauhinia variegata]|uniref:Uncharacterized protein n=1 Tax=Bauhinia variegata TaxID=167791 RepID=A0ACB9PBC8_BAUVA|nr:hypothetical protein L6164_013202 [Bauhinia variegata]
MLFWLEQMDKEPDPSSPRGFQKEESDFRQDQATPTLSLSQGQSQFIEASGPLPQHFLSNSQIAIYPQQMHQESQPLGASRSPLWTPQHFSSNSQNSLHPEHMHQLHNRVLEPNLHGQFPYCHPPVRGINPRNDHHLPAVSKLPPEHGLNPTVQQAQPFPYAHNSLGERIGVLPPQQPRATPLPPPLPLWLLLPPQPYPLTASIWQEDPVTAGTGVVSPLPTLPPPQPSVPPPPSPMPAYPTRQRNPVGAGIGILRPQPPPPYTRTPYPAWHQDPAAASG